MAGGDWRTPHAHFTGRASPPPTLSAKIRKVGDGAGPATFRLGGGRDGSGLLRRLSRPSPDVRPHRDQSLLAHGARARCADPDLVVRRYGRSALSAIAKTSPGEPRLIWH